MVSIAIPTEPPEPTEQATTHLRAYMATALTGLPDSEREKIFALGYKLRSLCVDHEVVLYLPFDHTDPVAHADVPASLVYERDRRQVVTSDFVLMLCSSASYGVGQENEIAADNGVPVAYLVQNGCQVSRMLLGSDTRKIVISYDSVDDLIPQVKQFLSGTVPGLRERRLKLGTPEPLGLGARLADLRTRSDITRRTIADLVGCDEQWLTRLEENPAEEASLTLSRLRTIATFLSVDIAYLLLGATGSSDERMRRSLDHLKSLAREEDMSYKDYEELWEFYLQDTKSRIGFVAATRNTHVVSKEQWRSWYRRLTEKRGGAELQF
jgi:transcriptional regulator with XRE-family HTH domain